MNNERLDEKLKHLERTLERVIRRQEIIYDFLTYSKEEFKMLHTTLEDAWWE